MNGYRVEIGLRDRYRAQRTVVKQTIKVAKRMADWRWGQRLGSDFEGRDGIRDANGQILRDGIELRRRWAEYFEEVLMWKLSEREI